MTIKVTIYNEFIHERRDEAIRHIYPHGIHGAIASHLSEQPDIDTRTATLDDPEHGLGKAVLAETDVLVWWGHLAHDKVGDAVVERVHERVLKGMGLIVLHSGHHSKIFRRLMGTSCSLSWREANERERMWVVSPNHPITQGIGRFIVIPGAETYGEFFDIPDPDELIFISWFEGGEVFRSGATWHRGQGRIFYFRPGHETYPIFHQEEVIKVLTNAVRWARFQGNTAVTGIGDAPNVKEPPEPVRK
jgi:trehalose utilization protein